MTKKSKCGAVQRSVRSHMRRGRLTESGKINMRGLDFTPNMKTSDSSLKRKRKCGSDEDDLVNIKKLKSRKRTLYKRLKIIKHITECHYWEGIGKVKRNASEKMISLYNIIHNPDGKTDMTCKQWDGDALTAAACVYAAKLEFEQSRHGMRSPLTLGIIQHQASQEVIKKFDKYVDYRTSTGISMYKSQFNRICIIYVFIYSTY